MDYGRQGNNYYGRGRSPSPRDRFRRDSSRGRDNYGRRDEGWSRGADRRESDRKAPERYLSTWRRDAPDRSTSGGHRSRSPSHDRNRSRSGSRGRVRYRDDSRSPRRRLSSPGSRRIFKRGSSSSSHSSSYNRSRSSSRGRKHEQKEDIFNSMYADREEQREPAAYLHPSLNKSALDIATTQTAHTASTQRAENITAQAVLTTAGFAALSQAYGGNSPKKSYARHEIDDEDRFLYGDDDAVAQVEKPAPPVQVQPKPVFQPIHPTPANNTDVTPGGFDSNALKNVLKAIGFDFEMSKQQSHVTQPVLKESPPKPASTPQPARPPPQHAGEVPQRIQTISSGHSSQLIQPTRAPPILPTHAPPHAPPQHQYFQPYDPYNPESYTAQPVQHPIEPRPMNMSYPITIQDPNNPGNTLIVYRPMNPSTQPHPHAVYQQPAEQPAVTQQGGRVVYPRVYQQPAEQPAVTQQGGRVVFPPAYQQPAEQPAMMQQGGRVVFPPVYQQPAEQPAVTQQDGRVGFPLMYQQPAEQPAVQTQQGGRVVLPPQRQDSVPAGKKSEKEIRQERLNYLQAELEKLKQQQNELLRKKRREKDGHKDPLIKKNTMLQAGVEEQIREIREAAERAAGIESESSDDDADKKADKEVKHYNYFDPGKHWCRLCNIFSEDLATFLSHLHSKIHRKAIDPYDRPWDEGEKKPKELDAHSKALKGSEFLIPITGYYCKLCQIFSGDQMCADDHLKSYEHNATYKKHCKKNQSYEKKYKRKKKAALELVTNGDKKKEVKREPMEAEVKFVDTPTPVKKEKELARYVEKESPRYVEKESPRYVEKELPRYVEKAAPRYVEKESTRYVEKELPRYVEKAAPRYVEKESTRYVEKESTRYVEKELPRYVEKVSPRYVEKAAQRYVEKESPRYVEKEAKYVNKQMKYSDQQVKYGKQLSYVDEKPFGLGKREKKSIKEPRDQSQEQSADIGRESGRRVDKLTSHEERKLSKKYSDEYAERPQRTSDHGRRKRDWSPGYDEYERQQQDERNESKEKRRNERDEKQSQRSRSRDLGERWIEKPPQGFDKRSDRRRSNKESIAAGAKIPTPGFGKFNWNSGDNNDSSGFDQVPVDNLVPTRDPIDKYGEFSGKGKIAIKITGKTQYPQRLSTSSTLSKNNSHSAVEEKRAAMALELQRKVEALKRENALRNQLSSITLPSGRITKQQPKPNTAAVMLGTRSIGKHNTLLLAKKNSRRGKKDEEVIITHDIEVDVSPPPPPKRLRQPPPTGNFEPPPPGNFEPPPPGNFEPPPPGNFEPPPPGNFEPPPPGEFEPLPPGEEEFSMGGIDDANSDASGISMEIASDED